MKITTKNKRVEKLIYANQRDDGQLSAGVYIAMQYDCDTGHLAHLWIGTPETGPLLAFHEGFKETEKTINVKGVEVSTKRAECYNSSSSWSPVYSRGNYGKEYACGGTWSGHCRNLLKSRLIGEPGSGDQVTQGVMADGKYIAMPKGTGIEADVQATSFDCSSSWSVWFNAASEALNDMLDSDEINRSSLPQKTKDHLLRCDYDAVQKRVREVMEAFEL